MDACTAKHACGFVCIRTGQGVDVSLDPRAASVSQHHILNPI